MLYFRPSVLSAVLLVGALIVAKQCDHDDCWCGSDMARAQFFCAKHDPKYKCTNPGSVSYCASLTDPKFPLYKCISGVECKQPTPPPTPPPTPAPTPINHEFQVWLQSFGHDDFEYPEWVADQKSSCNCTGILSQPECFERTATGDVSQVDWRSATDLTWCVAKQWLLEHMPSFDKVSEIHAIHRV